MITQKEIRIAQAKLVGGGKTIPLVSIRSIKTTSIPIGLRLSAMGLYIGYYSIPSLGRAYVTMTDRDNFIITPRNPEKFVEAMKIEMDRVKSHSSFS
ncbi:MAG: hypothetical protein ACE5OY_01925 [Candidatus Bathyarchaeia archaeon]